MTKNSVNKIAKIISIVMLLVILSNIVFAMGIGPSRQYLTFASGQKMQGELIVINDGGEDFRAAVYPQGDLTEYIKISEPLIDVAATDAMVRIPYEINFPISPPTPGEHKLEIVVRQFPPDADVSQAATVSANLALISQIIVKVPYPGKYAESKLFIGGEEDIDTPVTFSLVVYNFGTEDINEAQANIEIYGPTMEKVAELETGKEYIKSKDEARLEVSWNPEVEKGTYRAVATVTFDGKQHKIEQEFDLGTFVIDVSDISVEKFRLGDVAKFDITLFNSWNTEIKDVYVEMLVNDATGKKMTEFKTAVVDLPAKQGKELEAYWYTEDVAPGIYKVKLLVHYAGKLTQKEYDFEVDTNSITMLGTDFVGQAISAEEKAEVTSQGVIIMLILIVLVLLIGMNVVWFYVLSKKLKGKEGGGEK